MRNKKNLKMKIIVLAYLCTSSVNIGCTGRSEPIRGGTSGILTSDGIPMSQMELTVYQDEPFTGQPLGYGNVQSDGHFELIDSSRRSALILDSGSYRFTIESQGAEIEVPVEYRDANRTSIRLSIQDDSRIEVSTVGLSNGM